MADESTTDGIPSTRHSERPPRRPPSCCRLPVTGYPATCNGLSPGKPFPAYIGRVIRCTEAPPRARSCCSCTSAPLRADKIQFSKNMRPVRNSTPLCVGRIVPLFKGTILLGRGGVTAAGCRSAGYAWWADNMLAMACRTRAGRKSWAACPTPLRAGPLGRHLWLVMFCMLPSW